MPCSGCITLDPLAWMGVVTKLQDLVTIAGPVRSKVVIFIAIKVVANFTTGSC
jgi:hypothetical protein